MHYKFTVPEEYKINRKVIFVHKIDQNNLYFEQKVKALDAEMAKSLDKDNAYVVLSFYGFDNYVPAANFLEDIVKIWGSHPRVKFDAPTYISYMIGRFKKLSKNINWQLMKKPVYQQSYFSWRLEKISIHFSKFLDRLFDTDRPLQK
jgi:hypothetical protein